MVNPYAAKQTKELDDNSQSKKDRKNPKVIAKPVIEGSYQNEDDPIGKLVHDFDCTESADVIYPILAKQIHYYKETEGGRVTMCKAVEEFAEKK